MELNGNQYDGGYFSTMMRECVRDLKENQTTLVFNIDHIEYLKKYFGDKKLRVEKTEDGFYLLYLDKQSI